jgi:inosine-uridine nucleoside N-ribohydrolase
VRVGYKSTPPVDVEWNIKCDPRAARDVFTSGIALVVAPLDATASLKFEEPMRRQLFQARTRLTQELQTLYQMWGQPTPTLFDPVAAALCVTERFCAMESLCLEVDDRGFTRVGAGKPNVRAAMSIRTDDFLNWYVDRVAAPTQGKGPAK